MYVRVCLCDSYPPCPNSIAFVNDFQIISKLMGTLRFERDVDLDSLVAVWPLIPPLSCPNFIERVLICLLERAKIEVLPAVLRVFDPTLSLGGAARAAHPAPVEWHKLNMSQVAMKLKRLIDSSLEKKEDLTLANGGADPLLVAVKALLKCGVALHYGPVMLKVCKHIAETD